MSTIQRIGLTDFIRLLNEWQPRRQINEFHLHCTDRPRRADFRGLATIEAMRRFHMSKGWSDIAQHLTVDPAGGLWTGRDWDRPPASAAGFNGSSQRGPFMIEVIGRFDEGYDPFDGVQRDAVINVIVAVLRRFGLKEDALRFHREFTNAKSCPGNLLDLVEMRGAIAPLLASGPALELPRVSDASLASSEVRDWFADAQSRALEASGSSEPAYAEVPEDEWMLFEQEALAAQLDADPGARAWRARLPDNAPLRAHAVNLSKGVLSTKGDLDSVVVTPQVLVEKHLADYLHMQSARGRPANVLFYAHGGLVNEKDAICYAKAMLPWWEAYEVFPIFFIWESGLLEMFRAKLFGARGSRGEGTDLALEWATQWAARGIWSEMKKDACNASEPSLDAFQGRPGGAWQLAEYLPSVLKRFPQTRIHAVGHSTGPIFLSRFLPLLIKKGIAIDTLSYLAPAIRIDRFFAEVTPLLFKSPGIREFCTYTMTDAAERNDTCLGAYKKSLLYFVRGACEDTDGGRILGLQSDIHADPKVTALFGISASNKNGLQARNGSVSIQFSPDEGAGVSNPHTAAKKHGDFDNDSATMFSVLERILGHAPKVLEMEQQFPSDSVFASCGLKRDFDLGTVDANAGCGCCCQRRPPRISGDGRDGFGDDDESPSPTDDSWADDIPSPTGRGRHLAVCIGIDSYRDQPLQGCVADSTRWADALRGEGFSVTHLTNGQATLAALRAALRGLVEGARPGDELVFQYSGHGASVPNADGTEDDGKDEALVPIDYAEGHLLADDEIYAIVRDLVEGATLTLFMDCCHAGSNSRARIRGVAGDDRRPRVMALDKDIVERYRASRRSLTRNAAPAADDEGAAPGVVHFAACQDQEYAWESNGEGDFTRAAMSVFAQARQQQWSNQRFVAAVITALGAPRRQQPQLWKPAVGLAARRLLGA
ncbi:caspase family protein [Stenotrophomonas sp.]|uniref:caspase family protein n=1 Tax=Stenotrophomonas sp. TaxID=69392 RepID=UPI002898A027|nr:caspase family protein [Stenotrophomonas sp.]